MWLSSPFWDLKKITRRSWYEIGYFSKNENNLVREDWLQAYLPTWLLDLLFTRMYSRLFYVYALLNFIAVTHAKRFIRFLLAWILVLFCSSHVALKRNPLWLSFDASPLLLLFRCHREKKYWNIRVVLLRVVILSAGNFLMEQKQRGKWRQRGKLWIKQGNLCFIKQSNERYSPPPKKPSTMEIHLSERKFWYNTRHSVLSLFTT